MKHKKKAPFDPQVFLSKVNGGRTVSKYRTNQVVYRQGEPADAVFYIQTGKAKKIVVSEQGKACGWEQAPRYLIRDRDGAYGEIFVRRLRSMGIRDRPTSPRSPWQNGYAERLIGSIRRECVDHIIVLGERHLRHVLLSYMKYYNEIRSHLSLEKDAPVPRAIGTVGHILCRPVLGGLHHQYVRI